MLCPIRHRFLIALVLLTSTNSWGQNRWQIGADAQLLLAQYVSHDPGMGLTPYFSTPTGVGSLVISHSLKSRGLFIESGVGYRQLDATYAFRSAPFNGYFKTNGIGIWFVPIMLRQDLMTALFPNLQRRVRISVKAGFINEFVSEEGVGKSSFSGYGNGISLTGRSIVSHHYSIAGCIGAELRIPIIKRRVDGLVQINRLFGFREMLRTTIDYSQNGTTQQAYISSSGSGYAPFGIGLRYYTHW